MNEPLIEGIMAQAQAFASSWALAGSGSQFEADDQFEKAEGEKRALHRMIAELIEERAALRKALAEKVVSQTMLRDLSLGTESIKVAFEGGAAHLLADALAEQFAESGATNYIEMHFDSDVSGPLAVTLQRINGKTPHQLRAEAEAERDALLAENERVNHRPAAPRR